MESALCAAAPSPTRWPTGSRRRNMKALKLYELLIAFIVAIFVARVTLDVVDMLILAFYKPIR